MRRSRYLHRAVLAFLALGIAFSLLAPRFSRLIETRYSTALYYWTIRPYSLLTGIFPFSLTELLVVSLAVVLIVRAATTIMQLWQNPRDFAQRLPRNGWRLALVLAVVYLAFNLMWGLNYSRLTFAEISGLRVEPASVEELTELALYLKGRANQLRLLVAEDHRGVMTLNGSIRELFGRAHLGFKQASKVYPELGGHYGRPKGVILSHYWSYTGIGGMYFPFTAEANVNINMPHFLIPFTTTHEMAHQRGFAREDEANYIAYVTSTLHPDVDFQYSGTLQALNYTMSALRRYDAERWAEVREGYSEGVLRDMQAWREHRIRYDGSVRQVSTSINDTYLMANRQTDGVHSYGRMVDLMLAEHRARRN